MRSIALFAPFALIASSLAQAAVCTSPATGRIARCPPPAVASPGVARTVVLSGPVRTRPPRCRNLATGRLGPCATMVQPASSPRTLPGRQSEPQGVAPLH